MARICRDCRQPIPPDERPDDHFCIGDTSSPSPKPGGEDEPEAA